MSKENAVGYFVGIFVLCPILGVLILTMTDDKLLGIVLLLPLACLIVITIFKFFTKSRRDAERKLQDDLHRIYGYPRPIKKYEDGDMAGLRFLHVIRNAIENTACPKKKADLRQCETIVRKMYHSKSFDDLHRAFWLTGCHLDIKDTTGKTITRIV